MRREQLIAGRLEQLIEMHPGPDPARTGLAFEPVAPGSLLTRRTAVALFECGLQSRLQDLEARRLKDRVLFGADYPLFTYERLVKDWRAEGYGEEILEKVFHKNAERWLTELGVKGVA